MKMIYSFEIIKEMSSCRVGLDFNGNNIADRRFEWGPQLGVPEATGSICADAIKVDSQPEYFTFFDIIGRDVTFHFIKAGAIAIRARQWHRYKNPDIRSKCFISIWMTPKGIEKKGTVPAGKNGKLEFDVLFQKSKWIGIWKTSFFYGKGLYYVPDLLYSCWVLSHARTGLSRSR